MVSDLRSEPFFAGLISKCLWSEWEASGSGREELKKFSCFSVNRECFWKKTQIKKKTWLCKLSVYINLFFYSESFLYPLETSENGKVFWFFQGKRKCALGTNELTWMLRTLVFQRFLEFLWDFFQSGYIWETWECHESFLLGLVSFSSW